MHGETISKAATRPSSRRERGVAVAVALALAGASSLWSAAHRSAALTSPQFAATYGSALTLCALFAALLLMWRARLVGDAPAAGIAAAFAYSVPLIALYAVTFPGVVPALASQRQASGWITFAWRIGWAAAVAWYALRDPGQGAARLGRSILLALVASVAVAGIAFSGLLPEWYDPSTNAHLPPVYVAYWLMIGATLFALVCVLRRQPLTTLDAWLTVPLTANVVVGVLSLFDRTRFEGAADAARILTLAASAVIVCAIVMDFARLMARARSHERFITLTQNASNIIYLLDPRGACVYMNRRWTEITGQPVEAALGTGWTAVVHPDDLGSGLPERSAGISAQRRYEHEIRYRSADGRYRWYLAAGTPTFDTDGKLEGWYGTSTDIDAQRRALDELAVLYDHLAGVYDREHRIAQTLQSAFIPPFLPKVDGLRFQAVYRPALRETELGGDWYDAFVLRDGRIAISIGDIAGHGIEAAVAMLRLRETLRAVTGFVDSNPGLILQMADRAFTASHPETVATAAFAIYDPLTRRLVHARAGHPPPALVRNGVASFLRGSAGVPLGAQADSAFESEEIALEPGDTLAFYTDGLTEVDRDVVAGERRFAELLTLHAADPERIVTETLDGKQRDDAALLVLSVLGTSARASWHFESDDAASAADARFAFVAHLHRRSVDPAVVAAAELVFGELVANVVRHAPGPIEIELAWRADEPLLVVRDRGPRFEIAAPALPDDSLAEGGRGLFIVARVAAPPVVTARPGGGNEVVVSLAAGKSSAADGELRPKALLELGSPEHSGK